MFNAKINYKWSFPIAMLNYRRVPFKLNFWFSDLWVGPHDCHGGHREAEAKGRSEVKICIPTASPKYTSTHDGSMVLVYMLTFGVYGW